VGTQIQSAYSLEVVIARVFGMEVLAEICHDGKVGAGSKSDGDVVETKENGNGNRNACEIDAGVTGSVNVENETVNVDGLWEAIDDVDFRSF